MRTQSEQREYRLQPWWPRAHVDGLRRGYSAPVHDENYKRLFSFPRMIEDLVLDERHVGKDDLPASNLMAAVVALEQSRSPADLLRMVDVLRERLRDPGDSELKRAFAEWVRRLAQRLASVEEYAPSPTRTTLEDVRMTLAERVA